jgi:hypothetical protein
MEGNPTVSYSIGLIEGYLESLISENQAGADTVLEYLKVIENGYNEQSRKIREYETKLQEIQLNLDGWKRV